MCPEECHGEFKKVLCEYPDLEQDVVLQLLLSGESASGIIQQARAMAQFNLPDQSTVLRSVEKRTGHNNLYPPYFSHSSQMVDRASNKTEGEEYSDSSGMEMISADYSFDFDEFYPEPVSSSSKLLSEFSHLLIQEKARRLEINASDDISSKIIKAGLLQKNKYNQFVSLLSVHPGYMLEVRKTDFEEILEKENLIYFSITKSSHKANYPGQEILMSGLIALNHDLKIEGERNIILSLIEPQTEAISHVVSMDKLHGIMSSIVRQFSADINPIDTHINFYRYSEGWPDDSVKE